MKLNKQAINLTIALTLLTVAVYSWTHGLNNITLLTTALLILGGLAQMLTARTAALRPQPVREEVVESRQAK